MRFKRNRKLLGKILLLLVMLLVVMSGLAVFGCAGIKSVPEGGSGVTIANGTLFLCPAITQGGGFGCTAPSGGGKLVALATSGARLWEVPPGTHSRPKAMLTLSWNLLWLICSLRHSNSLIGNYTSDIFYVSM